MKYNIKLRITLIGLMVLFISTLALWLYSESINSESNVVNKLRVFINPIYNDIKLTWDLASSENLTLDVEKLNSHIRDLGKTEHVGVTIIDLKGKVVVSNQQDILLEKKVSLEEALYMDQSYERLFEGMYKLSFPLYTGDQVSGFIMFELDELFLFQEEHQNTYLIIKKLIILEISMIIILFFIMIRLIYKKEDHELEIFKESLIDLSKGILKPINMDLCREYKDLFVLYNIVVDELGYVMQQQNEYETKRKEFLTMISHELKTPIATINAYVEGLISGLAKDDEIRDRYQQVIYEKIQLLSKQIEELFKYSQEETGQFKYEFKEYYADEVFNGIFEYLAGHNKFETLVHNHIPKCIINVDRNRMEQVVMNLYNNAVKHSQSEAKILLSGYRQDQEIVIEISDQGNGIDPKDMPYIFDYYYQGSRVQGSDYEGIGLGLALCKDIIDKHGGRIKVQSAVSEGSTFSILIPVV